MKTFLSIRSIVSNLSVAVLVFAALCGTRSNAQMAQAPLISSQSVAPLVLLNVGRDEKLSFAAYNDYSDIDGDGITDVGYKPSILYYGYFDSYKCYSYSQANEVFTPAAETATKRCSGLWSGDFLNYLTMSRIDALRRVFYGGRRVVDTATRTVLERAYIPQDLHVWGREYDASVAGYNISDYTPLSMPTAGTRHLFANVTRNGTPNKPLLRYVTNRTERIWNWVAKEGPVADSVLDGSGANIGGSIVDRVVRVEACVSGFSLEAECKTYVVGSVTTNKPTGVLHDFGENKTIAFGLISGSYQNQRSGGVLRKNVGYFDDEVNTNGTFKASTEGIVYHLDRFKIAQWNGPTAGSGGAYPGGCAAGSCKDFGSPTAEIMFEGLRYFGGGTGPTSAFDYTNSGSVDNSLGLRKATWANPYRTTAGGFPYCAKPIQMVFSDVYPSYDSDELPGTRFGAFTGASSPASLSALNVGAIADTVSTAEGISGLRFIGESLDNTPNTDRSPSLKVVTSLGNIRGLAPGEPTRQGSYYSASVARFGRTSDINAVTGPQNVTQYSIALSAPLPKLAFKVAGQTVSLIPFAQSVGGCNFGDFVVGSTSPMQNRIAAFFIDRIVNVPGFATDASINGGRAFGAFRVSYEDNTEGTDSDMDAIATYSFEVTAANKLRIRMRSEFSAGCITQHLGFIVSGTTADRAYLGVRDTTVSKACVLSPLNDQAFSTDNKCPGGLGLSYDREFDISATAVVDANIPRDPLFYAAKWGGPGVSADASFTPATESVVNGLASVPGYFFVSDPIRLRAQLVQAFSQIQNDSSPTTSAAISGSSLRTDSAIFLPGFVTRRLTAADEVGGVDTGPVTNSLVWQGSLEAKKYNLATDTFTPFWVVTNASFGTVDSAAKTSTRTIYTPIGLNNTAQFLPANLDSSLRSALATNQAQTLLSTHLTAKLGPLATATQRLNETADQVAMYILGDRSLEIRRGGTLRNRQALLGDVVNSSPAFQGQTDLGWGDFPSLPEASSYSAFASAKAANAKTVYVGANDGLLHAFNADTGVERWAYLPKVLQTEVHRLVDPAYAHKYFVDGPVTVADAYWGGSWKTVVVATLGAGGKAIVAINVTNPASPQVLWEFTHEDLGFALGRPQIVRLRDGKWVVAVGNGYESARVSGGSTKTVSRMFLLDLSVTTASAISLGAPSALTVTDQLVKNGLGTLGILSSDGVAAAAWAGDLNGNLWKFDLAPNVTTSTANSAKVAYSGAPLFRAEVAGKRQPITAEPSVVPFSEGGHVLIFGTGKFFETTDPSNTDAQTVYAVWDWSRWNNLSRSSLAAGSLSDSGGNRFVSGVGNWWATGGTRGWRIDLPRVGERVVAPVTTVFGVSLIPTLVTGSSDPCVLTQDGTLLGLNPFTAAAPSIPIFDLNGDGLVNNSDKISGSVPAGITLSDPVSIAAAANARAANVYSSKGDKPAEIKFNNVLGRRSWRQVQ
jgi:type IV pilus assembly protein PilY1